MWPSFTYWFGLLVIRSFWLLVLGSSCLCLAQSIEFYDSIPVFISGKRLSAPWAGGLNSAQPARVDLDGDDKAEWVVFDRTTAKFTVLSEDGRYMPELEDAIPNARGWALWADMDGDGKIELLADTQSGIAAYTLHKGTFSLREAILQTTLFSGTATELLLDVTDYPAVYDIDKDGDMDFFNFVPAVGTTMEYHQNQFKTTGKLSFIKKTNGWGGFLECATCGDFVFGPGNCRSEAKLHAGSTTTLVDISGRGVPDLLVGDVGCPTVYQLRGEPHPTNGVIFKDFNVWAADTPLNMVSMPSAFVIDNQILFSPTLFINEGNLSDFVASVWQYQKKTDGTFTLLKKNFLQDQMIDLGEAGQAVLVDVDGDGDKDLIASGRGKPFSGSFRATLHLFRNISDDQSPVFSLEDEDYQSLSDSNFTDIKLTAGDWDGDGQQDLLWGARVINSSRRGIYTLRAMSGRVEKLNLPYEPLDAPVLADLQGDGKPELLIAKFNGALALWRNQNGQFILESPSVCGLIPNSIRLNLAVAVMGRDLLAISNAGTLWLYRNFADSLSQTMTPQVLMKHRFGRASSLAVYGDKLLVGQGGGGFNCLKIKGLYFNDSPVPTLYPNPTSLQSILAQMGKFDYTVWDALGRHIMSGSGHDRTTLDGSSLPQATYFVEIKTSSSHKILRWLIVR